MATELSALLAGAGRSLMYVTDRPDIVFVRGRGSCLWDTEGRRYLDLVAGWAVCSLGHAPPVIADALARQAAMLIDPSPAYYNQPMIEFAGLLTEISGLDKVFFASSGAEANEGAVKLARKYGQVRLGGAYEVITAWNGFHGRTLTMMAATGKKKWDGLFEPKPKGFTRVPFNDIDALRRAVGRDTCAVMLEPVQGEGGVIPADRTYLQQVRELCTENNILLILDEIQTGLGRLGHMFACQYYEVKPDIMTLGKGIGGGFPLSALLAADPVCCFEAGDQGGTYCGTPLATAVGRAVVAEIIRADLPRHVRQVGRYLRDALAGLQRKYDGMIKEVRGMGLLIAVEFSSAIGPRVRDECLRSFLLINSPTPSCIRFMPALTLTEAEVDEAVGILDKVLQRMN